MNTEWLNALIGGGIIGIAVTLMLLLNGRVTGISGIFSGMLGLNKGDFFWRFTFFFGLLIGGLVLHYAQIGFVVSEISSSYLELVLAGIIVGLGTVLGSGCTSGHGVCGISRMSIRSIIATTTFIGAGIISVYLLRALGVLV